MRFAAVRLLGTSILLSLLTACGGGGSGGGNSSSSSGSSGSGGDVTMSVSPTQVNASATTADVAPTATVQITINHVSSGTLYVGYEKIGRAHV